MSELTKLTRNIKALVFRSEFRIHDAVAGSVTRKLYDACADLNYFFNPIPQRKLVYIEVPKAACTKMKSLLSNSVYKTDPASDINYHDRKELKLPSPIQLGYRRFEKLLKDPDTIVFTVTRNPFSRLRSCYSNKFQHRKLSEPDRRAVAWFTSLIGNDWRERIPQVDIERDRLSFDSFVRFACAGATTTNNGHWMSMSRIVPINRGVDIKVIKLENLVEEISPVLDRLGAPDELRQSLTSPVNTSSSVVETEWTEELIEIVRQTYAQDFSGFGYEPLPEK